MKTFDRLIHPDLINGNIAKSIICFAIPLVISFIFNQLYNAVDTIIVGHYLKETSLAAIGASASINELLVGFGIGFGNGMGIVAARAFGANNEDKLKKIVVSSIIITIVVMILIIIVSNLFLNDFLILLKTPEAIRDEAYSYISIVTVFCGVLFIYNLFAALLRAIGNSFIPLIFLIFSSLLNIFLDVIFITKFNSGIKGAAIATVIAQFISALLCFIYILKTTKILIPSKKHFVFEKSLYKDLIGQGLSMACMGAIVSSGSVIVQSAINGFGTYIIAGHISARKIFSFTSMIPFMLGMSSATFVSQNLGANKIDRIKKGVLCCVIISIVWAILLTILSFFIIRPLIAFISGSQNEEVLNYGTSYLRFAIPFYAVLGILLILRNSLQGLGSKILPLISSVIELLGKILFTALIIPALGIWGIILCEPLIWCVMTIQLAFVFIRHPIFKKNYLI